MQGVGRSRGHTCFICKKKFETLALWRRHISVAYYAGYHSHAVLRDRDALHQFSSEVAHIVSEIRYYSGLLQQDPHSFFGDPAAEAALEHSFGEFFGEFDFDFGEPSKVPLWKTVECTSPVNHFNQFTSSIPRDFSRRGRKRASPHSAQAGASAKSQRHTHDDMQDFDLPNDLEDFCEDSQVSARSIVSS